MQFKTKVDESNWLQQQIEQEQYRAICAVQPAIFVSSLAVTAFVSYLVMGKTNTVNIISWVLASLTITLIRQGYTIYVTHYLNEKINRTHALIFTLIAGLWGGVWAVATLLFFPLLEIPEQAAFFAAFVAMIAAASSSMSAYMPAFYAFTLPYTASMGSRVFTHFPSAYHINVLIFIFVLVSLIGTTRKSSQRMTETMKLRFKNDALLQEARKQKEEAEKANQAKSVFLASASHDLRQPMHALTLFASALIESGDDRQRSRALAHQINHSVDALQSLFNALLDISRLDANTLQFHKIHFSSTLLTERLAPEFSVLAANKQLGFHMDETPVPLFTDPDLLEQILRNLMANAIRYTAHGHVSITLIPDDQQVRIDVSDTGIGIDEKDQSTIFDEFTQLNNPERDQLKGLGLGLSIVRRVAGLLNHDIKLRSEVNHGSTFSVYVDKGDTNLLPAAEHKPSELMLEGQGMVVVIDDNLSILQAMNSLIETWGFQVVSAVDTTQALNALIDNDRIPDFIIADYRLREGHTGIDAIEAIRSEFNLDIPAIIISADTAAEPLKKIQAHGLSVLHKPVAPDKLKQFLASQSS